MAGVVKNLTSVSVRAARTLPAAIAGCPSCAGHVPTRYTELCRRCSVVALAIIHRGRTAARVAFEHGQSIDEVTRNGVTLDDANWLDDCEQPAAKERVLRLSWATVRGAELDLVSRSAVKPAAMGSKR